MWKKMWSNLFCWQFCSIKKEREGGTKLYSWKSVFFSMYFQKKIHRKQNFISHNWHNFEGKILPFLPNVQRQGNLFSNIVFETEPVLKNGFLFWTERVFKGQQCFKTRVLKKCLFTTTKNTGFESLVGVEKNIVFEEEPALKDGFFFWKDLFFRERQCLKPGF